MTATAPSPFESERSEASGADATPLSLVEPTEAREAREARAEGAVFRDAMIGAVIGAIVCAPIWVGLVAIALRGAGTALWPPLAMAAGIGVVAGLFLGGWAGTMVGADALEHFERETRPKAIHGDS